MQARSRHCIMMCASWLSDLVNLPHPPICRYTTSSTQRHANVSMASPTPTSALDYENPETDTREAFEGLTEAEKEQHGTCVGLMGDGLVHLDSHA